MYVCEWVSEKESERESEREVGGRGKELSAMAVEGVGYFSIGKSSQCSNLSKN